MATLPMLLVALTACGTTVEAKNAPLLHPLSWYGEATTEELTMRAREVKAGRRSAGNCSTNCVTYTRTIAFDYEVELESPAFCALENAEQGARFSELCVRVLDREAEFADLAPGDVILKVSDPSGRARTASWRCSPVAARRERALRATPARPWRSPAAS